MGNDEDWWTLVFNPESRTIYVEHEWDHVPYSGGKGSRGKSNLSLDEFLHQSHDGPEHRELVALIQSLFEEAKDAQRP